MTETSKDPWPEPPELPRPIIMGQRWTDAVFLHWRIPYADAARFMPAGVVPDVFDESAWVGLIGFRMQGAGLGRGPGVPYFGDFNEINVRLYSREPDGTRGVVFLSLDASRLAVVLAARAAGIPYVWSRADFRGPEPQVPSSREPASVGRAAGPSADLPGRPAAGPDRADRSTGYSVHRFRHGARSDFSVVPSPDDVADDPLSLHLTARFGLHSRFRGKTLYIPNTHSRWPLLRAELTGLEDQLVAAAGIAVVGPPESVLFSRGVHTQFGWPRVLTEP